MDWFSWLSRSNLEPSLTYEYGLAFTRNEIQREDLSYFNHEFLQSMGISVAKHRLEILKLARKEFGRGPKSFSKLVSALNKTRKSIAKGIKKLIFHGVMSIKSLPEPILHREQCQGAMLTRNYNSEKETKVGKPLLKPRRVAKSGPLDGRLIQEKKMVANRSLKLSGPLDRNMQERLVLSYRSPVSSGPLYGRMYANKSPKLSGPLYKRPPSPRVYADCSKDWLGGGGGFDEETLWASLFQDMKPT